MRVFIEPSLRHEQRSDRSRCGAYCRRARSDPAAATFSACVVQHSKRRSSLPNAFCRKKIKLQRLDPAHGSAIDPSATYLLKMLDKIIYFILNNSFLVNYRVTAKLTFLSSSSSTPKRITLVLRLENSWKPKNQLLLTFCKKQLIFGVLTKM